MAMSTAERQALLQESLDLAIQAYNSFMKKPRPDMSVDGSSWQWNAMRKDLLADINTILEAQLALEGPFEVVTLPTQTPLGG